MDQPNAARIKEAVRRHLYAELNRISAKDGHPDQFYSAMTDQYRNILIWLFLRRDNELLGLDDLKLIVDAGIVPMSVLEEKKPEPEPEPANV